MDLLSLDFSLDCRILSSLQSSEPKQLLLTELSGNPHGSLHLSIRKAENYTFSDLSLKRAPTADPMIASPKPKQLKNTHIVNRSVPNRQPAISVNTAPANTLLQSQGSVIFGRDIDNNLVCPMCKKTFTSQATANRHFMNVHNKIVYKCEMCDYSCRKDYLKVHAMRNHGINEAMAKLMVQNAKAMQQ